MLFRSFFTAGGHLFVAYCVAKVYKGPTGETALARKQFEEMAGEAFRDIGILVFVFSILDRIIDGKITPWWTVSAIGISACFFLAGCYLERRRPDE